MMGAVKPLAMVVASRLHYLKKQTRSILACGVVSVDLAILYSKHINKNCFHAFDIDYQLSVTWFIGTVMITFVAT